jgi:hypothetical protein
MVEGVNSVNELLNIADKCEGCGKGYDSPANFSYFGDNVPLKIRWVPFVNAYFCDNCLREYTGWMESSAKYTTEEDQVRWRPDCLKYLAKQRETTVD